MKISFFSIFLISIFLGCSGAVNQIFIVHPPLSEQRFVIKTYIDNRMADKEIIQGNGTVLSISEQKNELQNFILDIASKNRNYRINFFFPLKKDKLYFLAKKRINFSIIHEKNLNFISISDISTGQIYFLMANKKLNKRKNKVTFDKKLKITIKRRSLYDYIETSSFNRDCLIISTHFPVSVTVKNVSYNMKPYEIKKIKLNESSYYYLNYGFTVYKKNNCLKQKTYGYVAFLLIKAKKE